MKTLVYALLAILLAVPFGITAEPDFKIVGTTKVQPSKVIINPPVVHNNPLGGANWHSHTCRACGTVWAHNDNSPYASHNCPSCGRPEYVQNPRFGTTTRTVIWR